MSCKHRSLTKMVSCTAFKALWDDKGHLLEEAHYVNGKLDGRFFERDREGREVVLFYKNNKREGPYQIYYPENEKFGRVKAFQATYKNNKIEGEVIEYAPSGVQISITHYTAGLKEGLAQLFDVSGRLLMSTSFKKDKREGPSIQYFPNKEIHKIVHFSADKKRGRGKDLLRQRRASE